MPLPEKSSGIGWFNPLLRIAAAGGAVLAERLIGRRGRAGRNRRNRSFREGNAFTSIVTTPL